MPATRKPRKGSMQFWPRKRAKRIYPKVRSWPQHNDLKLLGFAGYKVGMTHIILRDNEQHSQTKGDAISIPVTIVECPPIKIFSIRFYRKNHYYGYKLISELHSPKFEKELARKIKIPKKTKAELKDIKPDKITLMVYTQPKLTGIGKKKPELFEIGLGSNDLEKQFEFAKSLLDREVRLSEVFQPGQYIDIHAVTIGKGLQGPIKRFGISLKGHKSEKKRRSAGNLGAWTPSKVLHTVPTAGQMGFHTRTVYNKLIVDVSSEKDTINKKQGYRHYGNVKNDYLILKGSIPGPKKRLIRLVYSIRKKEAVAKPEVISIAK